jgi:hypothetical protein
LVHLFDIRGAIGHLRPGFRSCRLSVFRHPELITGPTIKARHLCLMSKSTETGVTREGRASHLGRLICARYWAHRGDRAPACWNVGFGCRSGSLDRLLSPSWRMGLRNGLWCFSSARSVASCMVDGIVPALRHHTSCQFVPSSRHPVAAPHLGRHAPLILFLRPYSGGIWRLRNKQSQAPCVP